MKYTYGLYLNPIALHDLVYQSGCPNFKGIKHQVPSTMNIELWSSLLQDYDDNIVVEFLKYDWPLSYT